MKRMLCIALCASLALIAGCQQAPDAVTKQYVENRLAFNPHLKANGQTLSFEVMEQTEENAVVKVAGTVNLDGTVSLVKENGKWIIQ